LRGSYSDGVDDGAQRDFNSGRDCVNSARRKREPQMKPGECIDVMWTMRLMNALTRGTFVSDFRDLKRRFK